MLKDISTEQLEAELEQRRIKAKEEAKPKQVTNPDLDLLRQLCQDYIDCLNTQEYCDDDYEHYIYEEALKAIFGNNIFRWIKEQQK